MLGSAGSWIQGRGWDQNLFPDKQFPTRAALDVVAPVDARLRPPCRWPRCMGELRSAPAGQDHPRNTRIRRAVGSSAIPRANRPAFSSTVRRSSSSGAIPLPSATEVEQAILRAQDLLVSQGLTSIHEMGIDVTAADVYRRLAANGPAEDPGLRPLVRRVPACSMRHSAAARSGRA